MRNILVDAAAKLLEIKDRHNYSTKGPWKWVVHPRNCCITLESRWFVIMDFQRWGMRNAAPGFLSYDDTRIEHVKEFLEPIPGYEHHTWDKQVNHRDANAIEKSWEDIEFLLNHIDELNSTIDKLRENNRNGAQHSYLCDNL